MKFSVLLPTRNRLELLRYAIETVRRQDYDNWEIIVSDNASEQDIEGHVRSLSDPRISYVRTSSFVPVTENWNNALRHATGDYVIMLGDDDCLLKGFFRKMRSVIEDFQHPDLVYTKALLYAYPGVIPGHPNGFLECYGHAPFFRNRQRPFLLERSAAHELVHHSMNLKMLYTFNMQHSVVSSKFIARLAPKGAFFQSPYPDFYATNVSFLAADRLVINPEPVVAVGISPKSFGYYFFNDQEDAGVAFLNNLPDAETARRMADIILPGNADRTAWLIAMATIQSNFGSDYSLDIGYARYRFLQVLAVYGRAVGASRRGDPKLGKYLEVLDETRKKLKPWERLLFLNALRVAAAGTRVVPASAREKVLKIALAFLGKTPLIEPKRRADSYQNILEVFERADTSGLC